MMPVERVFTVGLTIPDNAAFTACETLGRLGLPVAAVRRADVWAFEVEEAMVPLLAATIATLEPIFNPNKHVLLERAGVRPIDGEVWIAALDEAPSTGAGGRLIPGVASVRRYTSWRLLDAAQRDVAPAILDRAIETFLCNPAFEKAIR